MTTAGQEETVVELGLTVSKSARTAIEGMTVERLQSVVQLPLVQF